jgi:excisionase family DNA binding protein
MEADSRQNGEGTLSRDELARIAGVSVDTIDRELRRGSLECTRVGRRVRFLPRHVDAYLGAGWERSRSRPDDEPSPTCGRNDVAGEARDAAFDQPEREPTVDELKDAIVWLVLDLVRLRSRDSAPE